jgi:hypothetical protein
MTNHIIVICSPGRGKIIKKSILFIWYIKRLIKHWLLHCRPSIKSYLSDESDGGLYGSLIELKGYRDTLLLSPNTVCSNSRNEIPPEPRGVICASKLNRG